MNIIFYMSDEPLRVLHIDDEELWRSTVCDYLPTFGNYQIVSVESGEKALALLRTTCFDVVISDYQMPEMNGLEILLHIRLSGNMIPFILFTGLKHERLAQEAKDTGADFYVLKTGDPSLVFSDLNRKIIQTVEKYRTIQALATHRMHETKFSIL